MKLTGFEKIMIKVNLIHSSWLSIEILMEIQFVIFKSDPKYTF